MKRIELTFLISQRVPSALAGAAHRDVDVGAQVALLHVAVAGAEIAQDRAELGHIGACASSAERMSGFDTISISATPERLRSTKLMVGCWSCSDLPASCSRCRRSMPTVIVSPARARRRDLALADDRLLVLADLVALRQVGIEVVLPVEDRAAG